MSEERKVILQMVADGKITPEEADELLQAIDESERTARVHVADQHKGADRPGLSGLAETIERAVNESLRTVGETLRSLEHHMDDPIRSELHDKIRRAVERAAEKAERHAERAAERAERVAERAATRSEREAERVAARAERCAERAERDEIGVERARFIKVGVSIDKVTVERDEHLTLAAEPGDRLVLENRVGDVNIEFYHGNEIVCDVHKVVWGEDLADAGERADSTPVKLVRKGADVLVRVVRPELVGVGILHVKDTRLDYTLRLPHGTHFDVRTKVGNLRVTSGENVSTWKLETSVGDIDLKVPPEAGFRYSLATKVGRVDVKLGEKADYQGTVVTARIGDGSGDIQATAKTGDIRLHA